MALKAPPFTRRGGGNSDSSLPFIHIYIIGSRKEPRDAQWDSSSARGRLIAFRCWKLLVGRGAVSRGCSHEAVSSQGRAELHPLLHPGLNERGKFQSRCLPSVFKNIAPGTPPRGLNVEQQKMHCLVTARASRSLRPPVKNGSAGRRVYGNRGCFSFHQRKCKNRVAKGSGSSGSDPLGVGRDWEYVLCRNNLRF